MHVLVCARVQAQVKPRIPRCYSFQLLTLLPVSITLWVYVFRLTSWHSRSCLAGHFMYLIFHAIFGTPLKTLDHMLPICEVRPDWKPSQNITSNLHDIFCMYVESPVIFSFHFTSCSIHLFDSLIHHFSVELQSWKPWTSTCLRSVHILVYGKVKDLLYKTLLQTICKF